MSYSETAPNGITGNKPRLLRERILTKATLGTLAKGEEVLGLAGVEIKIPMVHHAPTTHGFPITISRVMIHLSALMAALQL